LIELIIAIVVLGLLATLALMGFRATIDRSTDAKQMARTQSLLREARTLYVQKIYQDPTYTWQRAVIDATADLPTFRTNALADGVSATGGTNLNTASNGWTLESDTGSLVYSSVSSELVFKVQSSTLYVASYNDATGKGVFGYVSQETPPVVWAATCSGSSCDAESATLGTPAGGAYAPGTTTGTTTTPTTVPAPTCATGGVCAIGNTGPGGGIVFYVQAAGGTFPCGATLTATCKYLEAAPTSGTLAWTDAPYEWSGSTETAIGAPAQGTVVGTGLKNTEAIVAQSNTAGKAATITRAYRGPNNLSDWYLPSKNELNQMHINRVVLGNNFAISPDYYWSSSEFTDNAAWYQYFGTSGYQNVTNKYNPGYVRPVRAF
jgi:type II secretory pathway pseudopilin PulG